jgi:Tfp pilus assembly protein PilV
MKEHGLSKVNETTIFKARERMQQIREGAVQQTSATRRRQQRKVEAKRDVVPKPPMLRPSPVVLQAQSQQGDPTNPVKPTQQAPIQERQSNFTPSEPLPVVKKPFSGSVLQLEED